MGPVLSACSKSAIRSSIPTDIRMKSSVRPRALWTYAGMTACDMKLGKAMVEIFKLKLLFSVHNSDFSLKRADVKIAKEAVR
ncbi:hypothetical protein L1987_82268 [Smallanthus sonchifolius]|uniref:Uncharacterized protein n=1 Tax=Smallanthus sonchifolius TaxID=185202 RepID=A0ACB8Y9I0_9ASTR|nr:hypothetical protein L1987_82268 [Smallanthus sonchifolius]